ncbi:MAG: IS1182 family transposase, partial [bacterium]|nr:IS1182 family transposase [bacterium]
CVEDLVPEDHKVRAIWELTGKLDLSRFEAPIRSEAGQAGRAAWDPRLLVSIWADAYSEGVGSAREVERRMRYEFGLRWLAGDEQINHHTLSDFRVAHREALDELFAELLAMLEEAGVLLLERVMHDGTKIRAQASSKTFRREQTLRKRLEEARELVRMMGDPRAEPEHRSKREAAQQRAARERVERLEQALEELQKLQAQTREEEKKQNRRVSLTEPEARKMKHGDGAIAPSYNAQISTDAKQKVVVGVHLSQETTDNSLLEPSVEEVERNLGRAPGQMVVDGGYTNRQTIEAMEQRGMDLVGSLTSPEARIAGSMKAAGIAPEFWPQKFVWDEATNTLRCPAGQQLVYIGQTNKRENEYRRYRARESDCRACEFRSQCCPKSKKQGRTVAYQESESAVMAKFRERMNSEEAKQIYRRRAEVAEFPNAWIKEKIGLRKFRVRGLRKAEMEATWACFAYNVAQWIRLCWRPALVERLAA